MSRGDGTFLAAISPAKHVAAVALSAGHSEKARGVGVVDFDILSRPAVVGATADRPVDRAGFLAAVVEPHRLDGLAGQPADVLHFHVGLGH